jgi:hypothetical protein
VFPAVAGAVGLCVLVGLGKLWKDYRAARLDLQRPKEPWEL